MELLGRVIEFNLKPRSFYLGVSCKSYGTYRRSNAACTRCLFC